MYKLHLILKYLRKRRIAWVSLIAVMLCTTMVIVVISVMGGWLSMFRASFRGLSGDVLVEGRSLTGFPYYEEMIQRIEKLPEVEAAVPAIQTFGLVKIGGLDPNGVRVIGLPLDRIGKVNAFPESLYRQVYGKDEWTPLLAEIGMNDADIAAMKKQPTSQPSFKPFLPVEVYRAAMLNFSAQSGATTRRATGAAPDPMSWPGMIVGTGVVGIRKGKDNTMIDRTGLMYTAPATLTVMEITPGSSTIDETKKAIRRYWVVDDSRTKVYEYDQSTVYVPFEVLQQDLGMQAEAYTDKRTGEEMISPARTSAIHVKAKPGVSLDAARDAVEGAVKEALGDRWAFYERQIKVQTWEEKSAVFISAVENEKTLLIFLFGIISVVAIFLIFCIFYMIVAEKTKDIGIIKSVGATAQGVAAIFLGYGAAIGIVGGLLGLLIGYLIVHNINELHAWLGKAMGVQIWNPEVYLFDSIPNQMNPREVTVIVIIAILSSVIGALVPAIRAARMHPIEALRWE